MDKIPLNFEASEGDTHKQQASTMPSEVVQCLENARFVRPLPPHGPCFPSSLLPARRARLTGFPTHR